MVQGLVFTCGWLEGNVYGFLYYRCTVRFIEQGHSLGGAKLISLLPLMALSSVWEGGLHISLERMKKKVTKQSSDRPRAYSKM